VSGPYDPDNFAARVNYAAQCFMRGMRSSRTFDTCFEMNDGTAVVVALVRRSLKNPKLRAAIASGWSEGFPQSWTDKAATHAHIPTRCLPELARTLRGAP